MKDFLCKIHRKLSQYDACFTRNRSSALKKNTAILRITLISLLAVLIFAFISSFIFKDLAYLKFIYLAAIILCLLFLLLTKTVPERFSLPLCYILYAMLIIYSIVGSAFLSPKYICVTIIFTLFHFPILYIDKAVRINTAVVLSAAVYLFVVCRFKDPFLITDEVINTVMFTILGCVIGTFTRRTQLDNFDMVDKLRMSEEQYRITVNHSDNIMCRYNIADKTLSMSAEAALILSTHEKVENVPYGPVHAGSISADTAETYITFYEGMLQGNKNGTATFKRKTTGGWRWFSAKYTTIFSDSGTPVYAVISLSDFTEQREKEIAYEKWKRELSDMLKGKITLIEWNLTHDKYENLQGYMQDSFDDITTDSFNARTESYAEKNVYYEDRQRYISFLNRERLLGAYHDGTAESELEYREIKALGGYRWLKLTAQLVSYPDSSEVKAFIIIKNIDDEKRKTLDTEMRAIKDPLTQLLNRTSFREEVTKLLVLSKDTDEKHAFVMIDIDNFKTLNDTFGHIKGDEYLVRTADKLRRTLRKNDLIGRLGGDEFVVFLKNMISAEQAENKVNELSRALFTDYEGGITASASIGTAMFPDDGAGFDDLYKKADIALYEAKKNGKNRFEFYRTEMEKSPYVTNATPTDR